MDTTTYRKSVSDCRACKNVFVAPRFGTGNRFHPPLMIVAQNPPQDPARCLHGAYMLHYGPAFDHLLGPHEKLVRELVRHLGLEPADVYATQAVKCPTPGNETPDMITYDRCALRHLDAELRDVAPRRILCFGLVALRAVQTVTRWAMKQEAWTIYPTQEVGGSPHFPVRSLDAVIEAHSPEEVDLRVIHSSHPSTVQRFVEKESWMAAIKAAYLAPGTRVPSIAEELQRRYGR